MGVRIIALGIVANTAVSTVTTSDGRGDNNTVANLEVAYLFANLFNDTHTLVTKNRPRFHSRERTTNHMEVSTADGTCSDANNSISLLFDLGVMHVVEPDISQPMIDHGFHRYSAA